MLKCFSKNQFCQAFLLLFTFISSFTCFAQVEGYVFKDVNTNGEQNLPNELGVANVKVDAHLADGTIYTRRTNVDGYYSFTISEIPVGTNVRIEFSELRGLYAGLKGTESNSTILFTTGGNLGASLGILGTEDYCQFTDPQILSSCYVNGDPLGGGSAGEDIALVTFPYTASGLAGVDGPSLNYVSKIKEVGSVWGMSYQASSKQFVVSALMRRHSGLGPLGTGGIYLVNDLNQEAKQFLDVKTIGINTGVDPRLDALGNNLYLPADKLTPNEDSLSIHAAGKVGIGSITLSQDEKTLYLVNLHDRKLYSMYVGVPLTAPTDNSTVKSYNIPDPSGIGEYRPWSVTEHNGNIYVGVVTTAEISGDASTLAAFVYRLDENSGLFTQIFSLPLTYTKGSSDASGDCKDIKEWRAWSETFPEGCFGYYHSGIDKEIRLVMDPQAILSSIAFDIDGSLILGFMDRFGLWAGYRNLRPKDDGKLYDGFVGGDILRAQYDAFTDSYELESNGVSGGMQGTGFMNGEGPGGGEFFGDDEWIFKGNPAHSEITNGGVMIIPGTGEIMVSAMDPVNEVYQSGGIRTFDRTTGAMKRGFALYSDEPGTLGKSGGVGEFKISCDASPIEIGNRIWDDKNNDGIQDPDETGVNGVIVTLHDAQSGLEIGRDTTSDGGIYGFNNFNTPLLEFDKDYQIRVQFVQDAITNNSFLVISPKDSDGSIYGDERDSDGELVNDVITITLNSGFPGKTTNSYDIGLVSCQIPITENELIDLSFCENLIGEIDFEDAPSNAYWSYNGTVAGVSIDSLTGEVTGVGNSGDYWFYLASTLSYECRDSVKVTIKEKPNAGIDTKICSSENTIQLAGTPSNGVWRIAQGNPSTVTFNAQSGLITELKGVGIYRFIYGLDGCEDTVAVERVQKPDAGKDTVFCNYNEVKSLKGMPLGGVWSSSSSNTMQAEVSTSGEITNFEGLGLYSFVYTFDGCTDTVEVSIEDCTTGLGDLVWLDENRNGVQDANEPGLMGVQVKLLDENGTPVNLDAFGNPLNPIFTNGNGEYFFPDLKPQNYKVKFELPLGYAFTSALNAVDSTSDSNVDSTGLTSFIQLAKSKLDSSIDAGVVRLGTIGDYVWYDTNQNGIQDIGENGVNDVELSLFKLDENMVPVFVKNTKSGSDGKYLFEELFSGKYCVTITGGIPSGYTLSPNVNVGINDEVDSDFDDLNNKSELITIDLLDFNKSNDISIDAGLVKLGSIGDFVWFDTNENGLQDINELGVGAVQLDLYKLDKNDNPIFVSNTVTNSTGKYLFEDLDSGKYCIKITNIATGYILSPNVNIGNDDALDSDFNSVSGKSEVVEIDLSNPTSTNILSVDAAIQLGCKTICPSIAIRKRY